MIVERVIYLLSDGADGWRCIDSLQTEWVSENQEFCLVFFSNRLQEGHPVLGNIKIDLPSLIFVDFNVDIIFAMIQSSCPFCFEFP